MRSVPSARCRALFASLVLALARGLRRGAARLHHLRDRAGAPAGALAGRHAAVRGQHAGQPARDLPRRQRRHRLDGQSVQVGLEPVAVAARDNAEVWVVNHLSDSISIVDVASLAAAREAHAAGRRRAARHRVRARAQRHRQRAQPRLRHHRAPRPEQPGESAAHHRGRRPRRRLGVRRDEPRRHARRHAARDPHAVRRHAARARGDARRQHGLRRRLPVRQPDDDPQRRRRLRRLRQLPVHRRWPASRRAACRVRTPTTPARRRPRPA